MSTRGIRKTHGHPCRTIHLLVATIISVGNFPFSPQWLAACGAMKLHSLCCRAGGQLFFSFPSPSHLLACVRPATARQRSESAGHLAVACPAALRSTRRCGLPNTGAKQGGLVLGPCCKIFFRCGMAEAPEWGPLRRWMPNGEMTC